jgi:dGTPase
VHDIEDGVHAGLIRLGAVDDDARGLLCGLAAEHYSSASPGELAPVLDRLLDLPSVRDLAGYDGTLRAQAVVKRAASELTGRFAGAAVTATRDRFGRAPLGRYTASLVVPPEIAAECALLKAVALHYVVRRPGAAERQAAQRKLLAELVGAVLDRAPGSLEAGMADAWRAADDDRARMRVVIDQVAQLTDSSALVWHGRMVGPRRPG